MVDKCTKFEYYDSKLKKCVNKEGRYKAKSANQKANEFMGTGKKSSKSLSEKFPKGKTKGKKITKKRAKKLIY